MHVIATVNSDSKAKKAMEYGADYVLDSTKDWEKEVPACTPEKRGVDVVLDPLGMIQRSIRCTRWGWQTRRYRLCGWRDREDTHEQVSVEER